MKICVVQGMWLHVVLKILGGFFMYRNKKEKNSGLEKWQSYRPNDQWIQVSYDLLDSDACKALTKKQLNLYFFAQRLRFKALDSALRQNESPITPTTRWRNYDKVTDDTTYITFHAAVKGGVYHKYDRRTFYSDRKTLIILGFLDIVVDGKTVAPKVASVYRMSSRWQTINANDIARLKAAKVIGSSAKTTEQDKIIRSIYQKTDEY